MKRQPLAPDEKRKKIKKTILEWVTINLGVFIVAIGVLFFKGPNNFATGGVSGIAIILSRFITPLIPFMTQSVIMMGINALLIVIGFIFLGKGCTFKTAYCSLMYTFEMWIMEQILNAIGVTLPLTDEKFLEFIFAILLTAIGAAILFNCGASSGGTDIIALIIKKYTKLNIGKALFATDLLIASSTFIIFDVTTGFYSILGLFFKAFLVDGVIESIGKNKLVRIVTSDVAAISPFILEGMHRSYTSYKVHGGYTGDEKTVLMTVCKRGEAIKLKYKIKMADPTAFVIITDTTEIFGKGFHNL